mmetsp:Transcript_6123/g.11059  ORF Transcript_6123/g.11059 Transcript_6123/m.11059 type:complete len:234 (-) Transcript_6123:1644-2345(-)
MASSAAGLPALLPSSASSPVSSCALRMLALVARNTFAMSTEDKWMSSISYKASLNERASLEPRNLLKADLTPALAAAKGRCSTVPRAPSAAASATSRAILELRPTFSDSFLIASLTSISMTAPLCSGVPPYKIAAAAATACFRSSLLPPASFAARKAAFIDNATEAPLVLSRNTVTPAATDARVVWSMPMAWTRPSSSAVSRSRPLARSLKAAAAFSAASLSIPSFTATAFRC